MSSINVERIVFDSNSGTLNVAVTSLTASNVDIRQLTVSDAVTAHQGGTWTVTATATDLDIRSLSSVTDSVSVVASALDIRQLTVSDAVTAHQGGTWTVSDICASAVLQSSVTVGTSAVALPASALTGRKRLFIQNRGSVSIYLGASGVLTTDGLELSKGSSMIIELGAAVSLYAISTLANQNVRVLEFS